MVDYPYAASFLAPLPAYPVNVSCNFLLSEPNPLRGLALAAGEAKAFGAVLPEIPFSKVV